MTDDGCVVPFGEQDAQPPSRAQERGWPAEPHVAERVHRRPARVELALQPALVAHGKIERKMSQQALRLGQRGEHALEAAVQPPVCEVEDPHQADQKNRCGT